MPALNQSPKYRAFILERDRALEKLLKNSHLRIADFTSTALREIEAEVALLSYRKKSMAFVPNRTLTHQLDQRLVHVFYYLGLLISREISSLMRRSRVLASVGEAEAIARTTGKGTYEVKAGEPELFDNDRIQYNLNAQRYNILRAFEQGLVLEDSTDELMARVVKSFPEVKRYKKTPRILKPIKEAEQQKKSDASTGFVDEEAWNDMVNDYQKEYVPTQATRGPETVSDVKQDSGEHEEWYGWEVESQINHDFITQVRGGQNEIAKQNGYTDMVWIAILDDRTDDCCAWRNGLTSSEIEAKLEEADDDCDAIVPPAHFNCRCSFAPYTEELGEPEKVDFSAFDEWIKNQ